MPTPVLKLSGAAPPTSGHTETSNNETKGELSPALLARLSELAAKLLQGPLPPFEPGQAGIGQAAGRHLPAKAVCARYRIVPRTLDRWLHDQRLDFPKPMRVNKRRYFAEHEIVAWELRQLAKGPALSAKVEDTP